MKELPKQKSLDELHEDVVKFHQSALELAEMATSIAEKAKRRVAEYRTKEIAE